MNYPDRAVTLDFFFMVSISAFRLSTLSFSCCSKALRRSSISLSLASSAAYSAFLRLSYSSLAILSFLLFSAISYFRFFSSNCYSRAFFLELTTELMFKLLALERPRSSSSFEAPRLMTDSWCLRLDSWFLLSPPSALEATLGD